MHPAGAGFFGTTGESGLGRVNSKKPAIEEDTCLPPGHSKPTISEPEHEGNGS